MQKTTLSSISVGFLSLYILVIIETVAHAEQQNTTIDGRVPTVQVSEQVESIYTYKNSFQQKLGDNGETYQFSVTTTSRPTQPYSNFNYSSIIKVYNSQNQLLQTIPVHGSAKPSVKMTQEEQLAVISLQQSDFFDINFDGYLDIILGYSNKMIILRRGFIWDNGKQQFIEIKDFNHIYQLTINSKHKLLLSTKIGLDNPKDPNYTGYTLYSIEGNQLVAKYALEITALYGLNQRLSTTDFRINEHNYSVESMFPIINVLSEEIYLKEGEKVTDYLQNKEIWEDVLDSRNNSNRIF